MKLELFVACDFAADYAGKLSLVGVFDTLGAPQVPVFHPQLCIAAKIRFDETETGPKNVHLSLTDPDGRNVLQPINLKIDTPTPPPDNSTAVVNLVFNIGGIKFERIGEHSLDLSLDGTHIASTPIFLRRSLPTQ